MGWNGTEWHDNQDWVNEIIFRKSHSMTIHERQTRTGESVIKTHEQYFKFILSLSK
jgi:hypothetical protein